MKRFLLAYLLITVLLTVALLFPYSIHLTNHLPNAVDPVFYAWNIGHNVDSFLASGKNLMDTNIFYPENNTLALSDTLYAQSVLTAPVVVLTHNPVLAENLYILATFVIAAFAMFFLAFYITNNLLASGLSGVFYAFCIPRIAQIGHMPAVSSQWIPLFILFLLLFFKSRSAKNLWLSFLFFILSITSSLYFGIFLVPVIIIAAVFYSRTLLKGAKPILLSLIPMCIILIIVLFPYLRLRAEYPGIKRGLDDTARFGAKIIDYATVLPTSWLGDLGFRTAINEEPLYPTITLVILAVIGILLGWSSHRKHVLFFTFSGLTSFLLSFGPYMDIVIGPYKWFYVTAPYYYVYKIFPLLQSVRVPARLSILVIFSLSALAAIGLSKMMTRKSAGLIALTATLLYLSEVWQVNTPSVKIPQERELPQVYQWLMKQPGNSIIVELPFQSIAQADMERGRLGTYEETNDTSGYALETYRVYFSYYHKMRMLNGYSGYFPQVYQDHAAMLADFPTADAIDKLKKEGVRYIVIHEGQYTQTRRLPNLTKVAQFGTDYVYQI